MRTDEQIRQVLERVREALAEESRRLGYRVEVSGPDGYVQEGDWLNVLVAPDREGVHAAEFAEALGRVDRKLRQQGIESVVLVPAKPGLAA